MRDFELLVAVTDDAIKNSRNHVQIWNATKLPDNFFIPNKYLGFQNGRYIYNLDTVALKQVLNIFQLEFDID